MGSRCSRISGGTPEARSRLCVCRAPFLMTFVTSGMSLAGSRHRTLLLSPVTSTAGYSFCFGSIPSFFLELFLHSSPVAYWAPTNLGSSFFQCPIFLCFHTVRGVLKARILKWFAIPFSSGPHSVRPLHHDTAV